jgi:hypothetical protein
MIWMRLNRWPAAIGVLVWVGFFSAINCREYFREAMCADCRFPRGVPFAYYREDALFGGAGIVWHGLVGDVVTGLIGAVVAAWLLDSAWSRIGPQRK